MSGTKFVLVVEDDDDIRSLIVASLKEESRDVGSLIVVEAKDGREAIRFAGRQEFHCVVTDLNMPFASGQELIKGLLGDSMNANTPTVVVSAQVDQNFLESFKNVRTITKPFDPQQLSFAILREIKLGRMDQRVPVHLLNPLVESLRSLLVKEMKVDIASLSIRPPAVRRANEAFEGDYLVSLTLTTGLTQARLSFGFDESFLARLKRDFFTQSTGTNIEIDARHAGQELVDRAAKDLVAVFGVSPRITDLTVVDLSDSAKAAESARSPGVTIALATDQGRVFISSLAPMKVKRGAA